MARIGLSPTVEFIPVAGRFSGLRNVARYAITRLLILGVTVVSAVYLTILIANFGGYVDEIIRSRIDFQIAGMVMGGWLREVPEPERTETIEATTLAMQEAAGLNQPFLARTFRWLGDGLTLDWGKVRRPWVYGAPASATDVRTIILLNLTRTLLVFGSANVLLFVATVSLGLALTRRHGSRLDRLFVALSPLSAAPAWVYGVLLSIALLRLAGFTTGGTFDAFPDSFTVGYLPILARHLLPPLLAIFLAGLFQGVYAWRTYFLIYSSEDYVDMARAKGLGQRAIERRYILRPALPGLITSFALLSMSLWQEVIALEFFFNVQGIGRLFLLAVRGLDTPLTVALVVTFAYLLAITVFLLDLTYALLDPRVRVGAGGQAEPVGGLARAGPSRRRRRAGWPQWPLRPVAARRVGRAWLATIRGMPATLRSGTLRMGGFLWTMLHYPGAVVGLTIILALVAVSFYTIRTLPLSEAIALWRGEEDVWARNPRNALPTWVNAFRRHDLPPTIAVGPDSPSYEKERIDLTPEMTEVVIRLPVDYDYGAPPQEISLYLDASYEAKLPLTTLIWRTPDGRQIELTNFNPRRSHTYHFSQDSRLQRRLRGLSPVTGLLAPPEGEAGTVLAGRYVLEVSTLVFEDASDVDVEWVLTGQVYGLAGTDASRRDLMVALLWGTPIALAFGVVAAVATSVGGMIFAALGAWMGGVVDRAIQFLTELNLVLPFFPVSLMVYTLYSKSIWAILGVTVALTLFGSGIKTYRAVFLQVKESPYIEAARAYGASDWRIVRHYLIPRIVAVLVPRLVILVPAYVFLEATLAFLGVSDPAIPTWGKLVVAALSYGIHSGAYHLVLASLGLLMLTGFAFALLGLSLERVFEPRLRRS